MCLIEAPTSAILLHTPAIPPGLSGTTHAKRTSRPSETKPRSSTLPSVLVSMLPPHMATTTFLPLRPGSLSVKSAAKPEIPAPSCTSFSFSRSLNMATAMSDSLTSTISSIKFLTVWNERGPTVGTARPSASVAVVGALTGSPASSASVMEAQRSGSTPMTWHPGLRCFTASAIPAIKPPPPTGITTASASRTSSSISIPTEPAPEMISKSSKPLMYLSISPFTT
mmetsp:Transcript_6597/g.26531  ORF Transcript_6597/g.26531 Transcript_6597/m.26531 type:complete len:225 (+) Transcript_6597:366-1040(+)